LLCTTTREYLRELSNRQKETAERIYRDAGVAVAWKDQSEGAEGGTELFVRIVRRSLNLPGEDFGIAFVGIDGREAKPMSSTPVLSN